MGRVSSVGKDFSFIMESSKPRFATILAARGNDGRPSDLEFMLRSHCQKLRVVEKLSGAHLLIPSESSLAIRAYFSCDLEDLARRQTEVANNEDENDDFDGLKAFMTSFKLVVVLFIIPGFEKQREQLDDDSSFFHRAQRLVRSLTSVTAKEQGNTVSRQRYDPIPRVCISRRRYHLHTTFKFCFRIRLLGFRSYLTPIAPCQLWYLFRTP